MPAEPVEPAGGAGAVCVGGAAGDQGPAQKKPASESKQGNSALDFPREQRVAIRTWARDNGYDLADRGAFSQELLAAYRDASEEAEAAR